MTTLDTLYLHDHPLPSDLDLVEIHRQSAMDHELVFGKRDVSRLAIGNFLLDIWTSLRSGAKFNLYSAHDTTLLPLLGLLSPPTPGEGLIHPPCASSLIFELYQDTSGNKHVGVIYNSRPLHVNGLEHSIGSLYNYKDFETLVSEFVLTDQQFQLLCHQ